MPEKEPKRDDEPQAVKPTTDGPREIEDAAAQEAEYPEDESNEG